jgi:hypothetical protein
MTVPADLAAPYAIRDGSAGWVFLSIAHAIRDRLQANYAAIGLESPAQVILGDEDPAYMDLPLVGVAPLDEGTIAIQCDANTGENELAWSASLYGAYKSLVPDYSEQFILHAGRALDLFTNRTGHNSLIDGSAEGGPTAFAEVVRPTQDLGVMRVSDYWIHVWILKLNLVGAY